MATFLDGDLPDVVAAAAEARAIFADVRAAPLLARLEALTVAHAER